jgi:hypothetical protein
VSFHQSWHPLSWSITVPSVSKIGLPGPHAA